MPVTKRTDETHARMAEAEAFVRSVVKGVFGQSISDQEVRRVAANVVEATKLRRV